MNVDGALNVAGMSLEILAVFTGVAASPAGAGARDGLVQWVARSKPGYTRLRQYAGTSLIGLVFAFGLVLAIVRPWSLVANVSAIVAAGLVGGMLVPVLWLRRSPVEWMLSRLPDTEHEVGFILGIAGGVFGIGVLLQLIAVATP